MKNTFPGSKEAGKR